jgi:hypothetical protein
MVRFIGMLHVALAAIGAVMSTVKPQLVPVVPVISCAIVKLADEMVTLAGEQVLAAVVKQVMLIPQSFAPDCPTHPAMRTTARTPKISALFVYFIEFV